MESRFELNFSGGKTPALISCCFTSTNSGETKHSTQGKDFGWGKTANAVVAMAMCAVAYKAWQASGRPEATFQLVGETGSAAHTLRGSLLKDHLPAWFRKVFGERNVGTRHRSYASQVFQPVRPPKSPSRKKNNHLSAITVDSKNYPAESIRVLCAGKEVSSVAKLVELVQELEKQGGWKTKIAEPNLRILQTRRQRLQYPQTSQLEASTSNSKTIVLLPENPKSLTLTTKKTTPQWADYRELNLGGKRLERLTCKVVTTSDYFRFGFKLLSRDGRIFGDGSIKSQDSNLLVHIGRNNWDRPNLGITAQDISFTHDVNGITPEKDKKLFTADAQLTISLELRIDSGNSVNFLVNDVCCLSRVVPPQICRRIVMLAWGDNDDYLVGVQHLAITTTDLL